MAMRRINILTDAFPAVISAGKSRILRKGRPKRGAARRALSFEISVLDDARFYLKLADYNEKEIDSFMAKYLPFPLEIDGQTVDKKYVLGFQKKMAAVSQLLDKLLKFRESKYEYTNQNVLNTVTELENLTNNDLAACHIIFNAPLLSIKEISESQRSKYRNTKAEELLRTLKDKGGQFNQAELIPFPMLYCTYDNILSWCMLNLVNDKLSTVDISVCECGRIFLRERGNQIFCRNKECEAVRSRNRTKKSRHAKAVKKTKS